MSEQGFEFWDRDTFHIRQLFPGSGFQVVYSMEKDGDYELVSYPCEMLAVAKVVTKTYRRPKGSDEAGAVVKKRKSMQVVALELAEGYWQVCNDSANFAGIKRVHDNIDEATGCLNVAYYPKRIGAS